VGKTGKSVLNIVRFLVLPNVLSTVVCHVFSRASLAYLSLGVSYDFCYIYLEVPLYFLSLGKLGARCYNHPASLSI
jgi:hypothetical protein